MTSVTLSVICHDEIDDIDRLIHDSVEHFDELHFAIDDQKVFADCVDAYKDNPKIKFFKYEWINDFADKRNFLASKVTTDYYFSVDTDDSISNPEQIRVVAQRANDNKYDIVYGFYIYSTDKDGNTNASHWKERLVRNNPNLRWNKKIHENIVPVNGLGINFDLDERLLVKHLKSHEGIEKSNERNLKYLIEEWNEFKEKTDPRTIAYLGRVALGMGHYKKAQFFLEKHIELSGWDEDRHLSWCQLATLHRLQKDYDQAIACAFEALEERPDYPDAYLSLSEIYFDQEKWTKAIEWGEQGLKKEPPRNFIVTDPSAYTWRPALSLSYAYWNLGNYDKALRLFNYAKKLAPSQEFIKENEHIYIEGVEHKDYIDHLLWLVNYTNDKDKTKVKHIVESIPEKFFENQTVALIRNKFLEPTEWSLKSLIIYCGETPEAWSPLSIDKGIGGSEEACVQLSKEFAKLGYEVLVYNNCETEGVYDGVKYQNHVRFNPRDKFNILIGWRCNPFAYGIKARKGIIWCHDLPNFHFTDDNLKSIDKVVMLSEYHKSLLPEIVPEDKIYVSTNGLVPEDYVGLDTSKREPHRIIYASSYDRGLETILSNWGDIRKAVPDAELHCYYGWNTYDNFLRKGLLKDNGFKERMLKLFNQEGVFEHGRIGHKELLKEYAKSSILAYPCTYAGEINCLALSKAIACGCYPLTNDFAVMAERNTHGRVVKDDKFIPALITLLRKGDTKIDNTGYLETISWKKVAEDWDKDIL
jgi:tetratricopeptide (TPR) repeat protein